MAWSSAVQQDSAPQAISSLLRSFSESAKAGKPLDRYLAPSLSGLHQRERVAALRRDLPEGAPIQDYEFEEGPRDLNAGDAPVRTVRLSELFTKPNRSLVIYHFMFGKKQTKACPMCTAWLDSANGVAHHLAQNLDFAVVAAADLPTLRAHARERGWDKLRLLSAGNNTFKYDLGSEDDA